MTDVLSAPPNGRPALVLNADFRPLSYYPLSLWCWQDVVKAVFLDRVDIIAEYDSFVRSPSFEMRLPSVIALREFVKQDRAPAFTRFNVFLRDGFKNVYRSKGFFWLATKMDVACYWSQAGRYTKYNPAGMWGAAVPKQHWPDDDETRREILKSWEEPWGDRRQELVFIGKDMDKDRIETYLNACLLTDEEFKLDPESWEFFPDPFPEWKMQGPESEIPEEELH